MTRKTDDVYTNSKSKATESRSHRHKSNKSSHHKSKKSKYEHIESSEVDFNVNDDDLELLTEKEETKQNYYSYRESDSNQSYLPHVGSKYEGARYSDYDAERREVSSFPSSTVNSTQLTYASNTPSQSAAAAAITSAVVNNRSVADLLRQRLKNKIPFSSAASSSALPSSSMSVSSIDNASTDYDTDMLNIIKIKKQIEIKSSLNKLSSGGNSAQNSNENNDHNNVSLADLVAAEKLFNTSYDTYHNMDQAYAKNILRLGGHYKGSELNGGSGVSGNGSGSSSNKVDRSGADEEDDIDMSLFQDRSSYGGDGGSNNNKDKKMGQHNKESSSDKSVMLEKQVQQEVKRYNQLTDIKSNCEKCNCRNLKYGTAVIINNNNNDNNSSQHQQQSFYISKSTHVCLKLKESKLSLLPHHCVLIPITKHAPSFLHCDEDTMREIERYKSCLSYQFQKDKKIMLILESSGNSNNNNNKKSRHHTSLDIIPLPQSYLDECIMYFKEAFLSMSHRGRLVELIAKRGLKKAVPIGFQYISVEWGERINSNSSNNNSNSNNGSGNKKNRDDDDDDNTNSKDKKDTSRTMSSTCTGLVLIFDRENEESDNDYEGSGNNNNTHQDFGLDVLAGMLEKDSYRIRRRMKNKHNNKVIDVVEEKKRYASFLQEWSSYDWTQYETARAT